MDRLTAAFFAFVIFLFAACSPKEDDFDAEFSKALSLLDQRQYERAIPILESLVSRYPSRLEAQEKLAHAYGGASGFEFVDFLATLLSVENSQAPPGMAPIPSWANTLSSVPVLSGHQQMRLKQAISLYSKLGFDPFQTSAAINFKWGFLYLYRFLVNLKDLVTFVDDLVYRRRSISISEVEDRARFVLYDLLRDFFYTYLLFRNSFSRLQGLADQLVNLVFGQTGFQPQLNSTAQTFEEFVDDLINQNLALAQYTVNRLFSSIETRFHDPLRDVYEEWENNL